MVDNSNRGSKKRGNETRSVNVAKEKERERIIKNNMGENSRFRESMEQSHRINVKVVRLTKRNETIRNETKRKEIRYSAEPYTIIIRHDRLTAYENN
jgi:hypothetical protein